MLDKNVYLEIDCCIWQNSTPRTLSLSYTKQSADDLHYVVLVEDEMRFRSVVVCPSDGVKEDIVTKLRFICKPTDYDYANFYVKFKPIASCELLKNCISYSATCQNVKEDNMCYAVIDLTYTILKDVTPTKKQCEGYNLDVFSLRIWNKFDDEPYSANGSSSNSYEKDFIDFSILWN